MTDLRKAAEAKLFWLLDDGNPDIQLRAAIALLQVSNQPKQEDTYAFQCQAQVTELKEALHQISLCSKNSMSSKEECGHIARTAIEKSGSVSSQDPVAWLSEGGDVSRSKGYFEEMGFKNLQPLYTAPPAPAQEPLPPQEPVAWMSDSPTKGNGKRLYFTKADAWNWSSNITPLYLTPQFPKQPKHEWVELTDDEIEQAGIDYVEGKYILPFGFARAIEAKLKEKNT